jgi:hypothetical protein
VVLSKSFFTGKIRLDGGCPTLRATIRQKIERIVMTNEQLELGYSDTKSLVPASRRGGRALRAAWWFGRMRHVVQSAVDWQTVPEPRPEQVWFPGAHREVKV